MPELTELSEFVSFNGAAHSLGLGGHAGADKIAVLRYGDSPDALSFYCDFSGFAVEKAGQYCCNGSDLKLLWFPHVIYVWAVNFCLCPIDHRFSVLGLGR